MFWINIQTNPNPMNAKDWSEQFGNVMNAGLNGGVPIQVIICSLELAKIDLANRQIMATMMNANHKLSQAIVDSKGQPSPGGN